jgi:hypothetical protein
MHLAQPGCFANMRRFVPLRAKKQRGTCAFINNFVLMRTETKLRKNIRTTWAYSVSEAVPTGYS